MKQISIISKVCTNDKLCKLTMNIPRKARAIILLFQFSVIFNSVQAKFNEWSADLCKNYLYIHLYRYKNIYRIHVLSQTSLKLQTWNAYISLLYTSQISSLYESEIQN